MYHIIKTKNNSILVLHQDSASYHQNLDNNKDNIDVQVIVSELPDQRYTLDWVVTQHNVTIDFDSVRMRVLSQKLTLLASETDNRCNDVTYAYSRIEIATWPELSLEAVAWVVDNSAPTPIIDAIASTVQKKALCEQILVKSLAYKQALATIGLSKRVRTQLKLMDLKQLEEANPSALLASLIENGITK